MKRLQVYTFQSFPLEPLCRVLGEEPFVFDSLKVSLRNFLSLIEQERPIVILGIARGKYTRFEPIAMNRFHGEKKVSRMGRESYELLTPGRPPPGTRIASKPTFSFCNWTAYKLSEAIAMRGLAARLMFSHCNEKDTELVVNAARTLLF